MHFNDLKTLCFHFRINNYTITNNTILNLMNKNIILYYHFRNILGDSL